MLYKVVLIFKSLVEIRIVKAIEWNDIFLLQCLKFRKVFETIRLIPCIRSRSVPYNYENFEEYHLQSDTFITISK